jgi:protein involved in sex pheromone biosynthesis
MKRILVFAVASVFLSSCVSVRFPEEIEVKVEFPQNASPEQIKAVMSGMSISHHKGHARMHIKLDSLPGQQ